MFKLLNYLTCSIFILTIFVRSAFSLPAFPGAEGFGSETPGGRGGKVIAVTNLNDSGSGSLREALTTSGPRIVVFRVAGTIELKTRIAITKPYITVAGQTAPGDGITIKSHANNPRSPLQISTHDVVLRYLRIRPGGTPADEGEIDAVTVGGDANNFIVDHSSFSWATDEVFQTGRAHDFTIQWSIIAEGLNHSTHPKGEHSKGLHFRSESENISVHHNLLAHNHDRNPDINNTGLVDMVNNVFYNAGKSWVEVKDKFGEPNINLINNYFMRGPSSRSEADHYEVTYYSYSSKRKPEIYVRGNIGFHRPTNDLLEELIVREDSRLMIVNDQFTAPPVTTVSAPQALDSVLENVGATLPVRDAHDQRIVNDVRNGTGKIIDDPSEVGGWLVMTSGTPPVDTDGDGMPDEWEKRWGLNPDNSADGKLDRTGDGYTNVEEYLNSLVASGIPPASAARAPVPSPEVDITPPVVSISDPKDASTVSGKVTVSAFATDMESGIARVQFKLNGIDLDTEVPVTPFSVDWDTSEETPGTYLLSAVAWDNAENETKSSQISIVVEPAVQPPTTPSSDNIYVTTEGRGTITNHPQCSDLDVSFRNEDILSYDLVLGCWSLYFDGSEVGLDGTVNAFHIMPDGSILISLDAGTTLPNVGAIANKDIVRFIPTSLGKDTAGRFELYFRGAAAGLHDNKAENIDAFGILPDGRLVVSISGNFSAQGVSGKDEDFIAFTATSLGEETDGTWEMYFDASEAGLSSDTDGVWIDSNGDFYLTPGDGVDIIKCTPSLPVTNNSCTTWDGIDTALPAGTVINGIHLAQ